MRPNSVLNMSSSVSNSVPRQNGSSLQLSVDSTQLNHKDHLVLAIFLIQLRDELYSCFTVVDFADSRTSCKTLDVKKLNSRYLTQVIELHEVTAAILLSETPVCQGQKMRKSTPTQAQGRLLRTVC